MCAKSSGGNKPTFHRDILNDNIEDISQLLWRSLTALYGGILSPKNDRDKPRPLP